MAFPLFNLLIKKKLIKFTAVSFFLLEFLIILFNVSFKHLPNRQSLYVRNYNRLISLINIKENIKISGFHLIKKEVAAIIWEILKNLFSEMDSGLLIYI